MQLWQINHTDLFKTAKDNGRQSCPKVVYGLAGYERTPAPALILRNVARHGFVEFKYIKEVRSFSYELDVLIEPVRDMVGAVVFTT
jgi:hypothetical protein